jgi:ABC-2 type transport system ATP-binding protein
MSELQDTADHLVVVGRGRTIADTSVEELRMAASGDRVTLRSTAGPEAVTVLERAGATIVASARDTLTITGLPAARVVSVLGGSGVPFSEVAAHRATLEEAYMELTKDAVEYRAAGPEESAGAAGRAGSEVAR